jgi:hypothetical protein
MHSLIWLSLILALALLVASIICYLMIPMGSHRTRKHHSEADERIPSIYDDYVADDDPDTDLMLAPVRNPRFYESFDLYWGKVWREFSIESARIAADINGYYAENQLTWRDTK